MNLLKTKALNEIINRFSFSIFRKPFLDLFTIIAKLTLIVLLIIINYLKIMHVRTDILFLTKTDLTLNSALIQETNNSIDISFLSLKASHFFYLTAVLIFILFLFTRIAPRKVGIAYLFLAIRTFLELLISIQDIKNNTLHIWFSLSPFDGAFRHYVEINVNFIIIGAIMCCILIVLGLIYLILPDSKFKTDFYLIEYKKNSHKFWIENIVTITPIIIFSTGIGNFLYAAPFYNTGIPSDYRTYTSYLFILVSAIINSILFYNLQAIKEPNSKKIDNMNSVPKKILFSYILINFSWFLMLCFYGIMFWDIQKHISSESLFILNLFITSIILGFLISYFWSNKSKKKNKKIVNSGKMNSSFLNKRKRRKYIKYQRNSIILIVFCSPLIFVTFISDVPIYPNFASNRDEYCFNMLIERSISIQDISMNSNGSFMIEISVDYNFSNVVDIGKNVLVAFDGFVIDMDYDSYFDTFSTLFNLSALILSEKGNYSISTYESEDNIAFREEGIYRISGFANTTLTAGNTIQLNLAYGRFKDSISILSSTIQVLII